MRVIYLHLLSGTFCFQSLNVYFVENQAKEELRNKVFHQKYRNRANKDTLQHGMIHDQWSLNKHLRLISVSLMLR